MNSDSNQNTGSVLAKSHKKSHITIVPIGSVAFNNIFNCEQPKITYEKDIGNDVTHDISF